MKKYLSVIALTIVLSPLAHASLKSTAAKSIAKLAAKDVITSEKIIVQQGKALDLAVKSGDDGAKIFLAKNSNNGLVITANAELMPQALNRAANMYRSKVELNLVDMSVVNKAKVFDLVQKNKSWLERGESSRRFLEQTGDVQFLRESATDGYPAVISIQTTADADYLKKLSSLLNEVQKVTAVSADKAVAAVKTRISTSR